MEQRLLYSLKVYLMVEHLNDEDFDYWMFDTYKDALDWLATYPINSHNWVLSSEPVGLPESEYTKWVN